MHRRRADGTRHIQERTIEYTYDAVNRLTSVQLPDSSVQAYTWDARGNLLDDGANTYVYNAAGRMIRAANLDTTITLHLHR